MPVSDQESVADELPASGPELIANQLLAQLSNLLDLGFETVKVISKESSIRSQLQLESNQRLSEAFVLLAETLNPKEGSPMPETATSPSNGEEVLLKSLLDVLQAKINELGEKSQLVKREQETAEKLRQAEEELGKVKASLDRANEALSAQDADLLDLKRTVKRQGNAIRSLRSDS